MRPSSLAPLVASLAVLSVGCAPAIGDRCSTAINCSITGDRVCDTASPGGVCTIFGCEDGTCPAEATCVRWRPMESRLSFTACMRRCESDSGCRVDEGYACAAAPDVLDPSTGEVLAEVVDTGENDPSSFCIAVTAPDDDAM